METVKLHEVVRIPTARVHEAPWNANVVNETTMEKIRRSLRRYGSVENSVVRPSWCVGARSQAEVSSRRAALMDDDHGYETLSGNHRLRLYREEGVEAVPCVVVELPDPEAKVLAQALNRTRGDHDDPTRLKELLKDVVHDIPAADVVGLLPHDEKELAALLRAGEGAGHGEGNGAAGGEYQPVSMTDQFIVPPFSVLDARQGYWRDRKRSWIELGIRSELGRGDVMPSGQNSVYAGSSAWAGYRGPAKDGQPDRKPSPPRGKKLAQAFSTQDSGMVSYTGTSIFDPVLCELAYRWFSPPGGSVLDPFAGGSVRGVVAALLARRYVGIDLRPEQVEANDIQWGEIKRRLEGGLEPDNIVDQTPVEFLPDLGIWLKRDDLFCVGGVQGGKVRTCWALAQGAEGLVTAGSRMSPQVNIVAHIARRLGIPCRAHVPSGELSPEVEAAKAAGAEIVQHTPGYNSVIVARAREDAEARGWREIPFGMECGEAPRQTATQVGSIPAEAKRLVVPVGSGMSLAGILHGLKEQGRDLPVLGVVVGADPEKRLDEYAPEDWREMVELVKSPLDYHAEAKEVFVGDVKLDPIYEAKAIPHLQPGDCLWVVGIRQTAVRPAWTLKAGHAVRWKFSAAWGRKQVDCTLRGIQKVCGAACCKGDKFWPPRSSANAPDGCEHLGPEGCVLAEPDKPVTCLLYPLVVNSSGTVVLHHKVVTKTAPCRENYGSGPTVIEALRDNLATLFGDEEADRIVEEVTAGRDAYVDVSERMMRELDREARWEANNEVPRPRTGDEGLDPLTPEDTASEDFVPPMWLTGDARDIPSLVGQEQFDFMFSCPPYADLEVYSDDPRDLSTLGYEEFLEGYGDIIKRGVERLKEDRFACFVVGDLRDDTGCYRNFVSHTIQAFEDAGARLYNEGILVTSVGSLPLRAGRAFKASRKLGKAHQNVLVFVKGDPQKAALACGTIEVALPGGATDDAE